MDVNLVQRVDDAAYPCFVVAVGRRAGVHDEVGKAERFGALDFDNECFERALVQDRIGRCEVDQIRIVGRRVLQFAGLERIME